MSKVCQFCRFSTWENVALGEPIGRCGPNKWAFRDATCKHWEAATQEVVSQPVHKPHKLRSGMTRLERVEILLAEAGAKDWEQLEQAMSNLKPEYAKIIRMRYIDGMGCTEVGEKIGVGPSAISNVCKRNIEKMKWLIRKELK